MTADPFPLSQSKVKPVPDYLNEQAQQSQDAFKQQMLRSQKSMMSANLNTEVKINTTQTQTLREQKKLENKEASLREQQRLAQEEQDRQQKANKVSL